MIKAVARDERFVAAGYGVVEFCGGCGVRDVFRAYNFQEIRRRFSKRQNCLRAAWAKRRTLFRKRCIRGKIADGRRVTEVNH